MTHLKENDQKLDSSLRLSEVIPADKDLGVASIQQLSEGRTSKKAAIWKTVGSRRVSYSILLRKIFVSVS